MKFSLLVLGSPWGAQCADTAFGFAQAVARSGAYELQQVFFFHEGAYNGGGLAVLPADEADRAQRWAELAKECGAELALCIASALRRGLLDEAEAARHERAAATALPGFQLAGLGQLVDACARCDRLVTFG